MTISHCLVYWRRVPHWHRKCVRAPLHEEKLHLKKKMSMQLRSHTYMNVYICLSYIHIYISLYFSMVHPSTGPWLRLAHVSSSTFWGMTKAITGTVCLSGVAEPAGFHDAVHRFSGHQVAPQVDQLDVAVGQRCICIHTYIYIHNIYICMIYAAYLIQSYTIYRERERATGRNLEYRHFFQNV